MKSEPGTVTARGFDIAASRLLEHGITKFFGLLGDSNLAIATRLVEAGSEFVAARHEAGVVAMASGYAIASKKVSLATVTKGPGLTNALTALVSANRDRIPVVLLTAGVASGAPRDPQHISHRQVAAVAGVEMVVCDKSDEIVRSIDAAMAKASKERRPVLLDIRHDVMHDSLKGSVVASDAIPDGVVASNAIPGGPPPKGSHLEHSEVVISRISRKLLSASRPIILAGRGATKSSTSKILRLLAERCGALLTTTLPASGLFHGDDYSIGFSGGYATRTARRLLNDADLVLVLGASLNKYTTADGMLFANAEIIHIDIDSEAIGRYEETDIGVVGDSHEVARALWNTIQLSSGRRDAGYRTETVKNQVRMSQRAEDAPVIHGEGTVDPRAVLRTLDDAINDRGHVVVDVGHFSTFACQCFPAKYPGQLVPAFGFGAIGLALGTSIGLALARPNESTVAVVGDGGLLLSVSDLEAFARLRPRLVVVVMNDGGYSADAHHLRRQGLSPELAYYDVPDFAALAKHLGVHSISVSTPQGIDQLQRGLPEGPVLIDVLVNRQVVAPKFQIPKAPGASNS